MDLQQVIDHVVSDGELPLFLMLDGVTDVRNIGAIARSAVCCGAQAIIIPDKGVGALERRSDEKQRRRIGTDPYLPRKQFIKSG
jgi:23S rRNA (guanosine2251-2'-O)-methyltransferase